MIYLQLILEFIANMLNGNVGECFMRSCYIDDIANALQFLTLLGIIGWNTD